MQLGELDGRVEFLRQALAKGMIVGSWAHRDPLLFPLRNHAGFKELSRPKV